MATFSKITASPVPLEGYSGQLTKVVEWLQNLESYSNIIVKDRDLTAPPASPLDGDTYIPAATATGDWAGDEGTIQVYYNGWRTFTPIKGTPAFVSDENTEIVYNGSSWVSSYKVGDIATAITASTAQTQGQGLLTAEVNYVQTVANANDTVTLPTAYAKRTVIVMNDGANTLQVFPGSGEYFDTLTVDSPVTLAAGERCQFLALDSTHWVSMIQPKA